MIIKLILRNAGIGKLSMRTDYKRESLDTPRINNLAMDILDNLNAAIERNQEGGVMPSLAPLYAAIAQVESDRGATSDNVYQLRPIYVKDVNRISCGHFTYADRLNKRMAEQMMFIYWHYYGYFYEVETKCKPTYEVLARIHNGGPDGWKKQSTVNYWLRVKRELERISVE